MAKISRPVVYSVVAAVAVYAVVLLTQPDAPPRHRRTASGAAHAAPTRMPVTDADLAAHFARYQRRQAQPVPVQAARRQAARPGSRRAGRAASGR